MPPCPPGTAYVLFNMLLLLLNFLTVERLSKQKLRLTLQHFIKSASKSFSSLLVLDDWQKYEVGCLDSFTFGTSRKKIYVRCQRKLRRTLFSHGGGRGEQSLADPQPGHPIASRSYQAPDWLERVQFPLPSLSVLPSRAPTSPRWAGVGGGGDMVSDRPLSGHALS